MSIKLRVQGLPDAIETFCQLLNALVDVLDESGNYANRGKSQFVRRYLDVALPATAVHITHFTETTGEIFKSVELKTDQPEHSQTGQSRR
ncbi:MAG: hypothetical protein L0154_29780 [Chloroflexi bacterium]|nr:hypothetical protein [Chloroflexota bacterium]